MSTSMQRVKPVNAPTLSCPLRKGIPRYLLHCSPTHFPTAPIPSLLDSYFSLPRTLDAAHKREMNERILFLILLSSTHTTERQVPKPRALLWDLSSQLCVSGDLGREFLSGADLLGLLAFSRSSIFIFNMNTFSLWKIIITFFLVLNQTLTS